MLLADPEGVADLFSVMSEGGCVAWEGQGEARNHTLGLVGVQISSDRVREVCTVGDLAPCCSST